MTCRQYLACSWVATTQTVWLTKAKMFTIWPFIEEVLQPLFWIIKQLPNILTFHTRVELLDRPMQTSHLLDSYISHHETIHCYSGGVQ